MILWMNSYIRKSISRISWSRCFPINNNIIDDKSMTIVNNPLVKFTLIHFVHEMQMRVIVSVDVITVPTFDTKRLNWRYNDYVALLFWIAVKTDDDIKHGTVNFAIFTLNPKYDCHWFCAILCRILCGRRVNYKWHNCRIWCCLMFRVTNSN